MLARNDCSESRFMWMRAREEARGRSFRAVVPLSTRLENEMPIRSTYNTIVRYLKEVLGEVLGCNAFSVIGAGAA